ncbi:helix-turn-helix domain-containing protein [Mycobacterium sp. 155]|uniref:helix-turn-helix domain-containing protein n=1 Tax=Mycobacterium sp. 155 TaxID=1157943 RepID=UPI00037BD3F8|nr:helix-turn-helix domain-containing protein [Mycobacterium sp. 155]
MRHGERTPTTACTAIPPAYRIAADDDWLTTAEVCAELECTRANVSLLVKAGKLRAERHGSSPTSPYRFRRSWIEAYSSRRTPDMLTVPEAAAEIGACVDTLWRALKEDRLEGVRVGSRRYIRRDDLEEYRKFRDTRWERRVVTLREQRRREVDELHAAGFLGVQEAAEELGVHRVTVQRWITAGMLGSERLGWRYGIRPRWIEKFRAEHPSH